MRFSTDKTIATMNPKPLELNGNADEWLAERKMLNRWAHWRLHVDSNEIMRSCGLSWAGSPPYCMRDLWESGAATKEDVGGYPSEPSPPPDHTSQQVDEFMVALANYAATFHDVTSGNNNGETAATGWDYPTGFGSLIANQIVNTIATPVYVVQQRTGAGSWVQIYSGGLSFTTAKVAGGYVWEFRVQGQNGSLTGPWAYVYVSAPSCGGQ